MKPVKKPPMLNVLDRYKQRLKEKQVEIEILREISATINYHWDVKNILQSVIKVLYSYTKSDSCLIYLIDGQQLVLAASQNPHHNLLGKVTLKKNEGITGWVARHNKAVMLRAKAYDDDRFKLFNNLPEDQFESFLSIPIVFRGKVIGVINVQNRKKKLYYKEQIWFIEVIASQLGNAIESARLISETDLLKESLEARKVVEKAKGILMRKRGLTEAEAHQLLNKKCMNTRKTLKEVAEAVILSDDLG
jgi:signal transduction protein with GAF and PtsI domain